MWRVYIKMLLEMVCVYTIVIVESVCIQNCYCISTDMLNAMSLIYGQ